MQVPNGTGPGVQRSKRPLLASRTRCNVLWKPPKFGNKVKIGNKVQFGDKFANWCNVLSIECVFVYGHVPECHVTFGRGRLHNVSIQFSKFVNVWISFTLYLHTFKVKLKILSFQEMLNAYCQPLLNVVRQNKMFKIFQSYLWSTKKVKFG